MTLSIYDNPAPDTPLSKAYRIRGLARVGIAAADSNMALNLTEDGFQDMFEAIGFLASDLARQIESMESKLAQTATA